MVFDGCVLISELFWGEYYMYMSLPCKCSIAVSSHDYSPKSLVEGGRPKAALVGHEMQSVGLRWAAEGRPLAREILAALFSSAP